MLRITDNSHSTFVLPPNEGSPRQSWRSIFEELVDPLSGDEFKENFWMKEPYAAPFKAKAFQGIISWTLLWEIFLTGHNDCWLPKNGKLPKEAHLSNGVLNLDLAKEEYQKGRTILVRHSEKAHPILAAVAHNFHKYFQYPIDIQIYCTPAGEEGFDWHYDVEEVFVIQSVGEKEFRLRQSRSSREIRCYLKAGDWLYIPSGWWHKAQAITSSYHFSVGVLARSVLPHQPN